MINFDAEIKKFHPCLELDEARDAINGQDLNDAADVLIAMMRDNEAMQQAMNQQMVQQQLMARQVMEQQMGQGQ